MSTIETTKCLLPAIGTPMGGGFFVDAVTENGLTYALIVAPRTEDEAEATWKQAHKLAASCRAGDHDDWRLPTRREALAMAEKLLPTGAKTPEAFREGGEQAFDRSFYWTAAEVDGASGYAWLQSFYSGNQGVSSEYGRFRVRAVRKHPL